MADTAPKDFSTTASSNGTVGGVNIAEGSLAASLNDAIRAVLAVIANADFGTLPFKSDTHSESTAGAGVTIDGLLIKDGDIPSVPASITAAIQASVPVGTPLPTFASTPSAGYLMMNGDTLGNASSGADQDSDDYEDLFAYLWDNIADDYAAVSGGRGDNAAADWAANKTIVIPDPANRAFFGAGDDYDPGETFGEASVTLTAAQSGLPSHRHTLRGNTSGGEPNTYPALAGDGGGPSNDRSFTSNAIDLTGGSAAQEAHNNVPPGMGIYWQIKY